AATAPAQPDARVDEERRSRGVEPDRQDDDQQERQRPSQEEQAENDVEGALQPMFVVEPPARRPCGDQLLQRVFEPSIDGNLHFFASPPRKEAMSAGGRRK